MAKEISRSSSVSRANAEHYRWGDDCDGWHLVKDANLSVIEELLPSGAAEVRHYHQESPAVFLRTLRRSDDGSRGAQHFAECRERDPDPAGSAPPD